MIAPPDCAFHSQTCSRNASRPISARLIPWLSRLRSTTICVAMPAWSVPTTQSASLPCIRAWRVRTSCSVLSSAWPMCSEPVTLGGGMTIVNGSASAARGGTAPRPPNAHTSAASMAAGSKVLAVRSCAARLAMPRCSINLAGLWAARAGPSDPSSRRPRHTIGSSSSASAPNGSRRGRRADATGYCGAGAR